MRSAGCRRSTGELRMHEMRDCLSMACLSVHCTYSHIHIMLFSGRVCW